MLEIIFVITLVALVMGSFFDLKTYEIPDWLNFSMIAIGLGINTIYSLFYGDINFILNSVIGLVFSVILAYIMFYTGQWGGGDSKMIMGLGALIGLPFTLNPFPFLLKFYINIMFAGAFYGIVWILSYFLTNFKKVIKKASKIMKKKRILKISLYILTIVGIVAVYFIPENYLDSSLKFMLVGLLMLILSTFFIYVFVKSIEEVCMIRKIPPEKLTEGDWIVNDIKIDGKYICGPKDLGIEKKQINKLIKLKNQNKIKFITIKQGIPFVPSFLFAFVYTVIFQNIMIISFLVL